LWLRGYKPAVLLIPLVSWATPAHVPEGYLLKPSIRQCQQRLGWRPDIVVGDLGYIHQPTKREIRQQWQVAVVTRLKRDMRIIDLLGSQHMFQGVWLSAGTQRNAFGIAALEHRSSQTSAPTITIMD
jgi:hypothetical protein